MGVALKKGLLVLLCLGVIGCAVVPKSRLESQAELKESLLEKDGEIIRLQNLLKEKERRIEQLRKKLEGLGVFE